MNTLSQGAIRRLTEIYLVANTPPYLYRQFRSDQSVQNLADQTSEEELVKLIKQVDSSEERKISDVAVAYAATVALTFKDSKSVDLALDGVQFENLQWVRSILRFWKETTIPTLISHQSVKPTIIKQALSTSSGVSVARASYKSRLVKPGITSQSGHSVAHVEPEEEQ